ncbi:hypothetical protein [Actinocrispum wychmicini]|uniref:Uncharacterized protein n=1 Tax=Actinocrispum wychmicini TaxID=1213861 RepID=A0A4R2JJD9_9PSEU|nr:hypothetical protein [Actinocrispum wychmicini]TCO57126.1 hypothetical protein EV192_106603 [Actinocrispum wychmicini]
MAVTVHGGVSGFQVETETNQQQLSVHARSNQKLSPAGLRAVVAALNTYYGSTLSAAQKAAMPDFTCTVSAGLISCYAAPGTEATLASALITAIGSNTVRG